LNSGLWTVTVTDYVRTNVKDDYPSNLLVQPARHTKCTEANQLKTYEIPGDVIKRYEDNLDHKHYRLHYQSWKKQWQDDANKVEADREKCKPNYKPSLDGMEFPDVLAALRMPTAMAKDDEGVLVFFTLKRRSDGVEEIDSFGRNVNYLWPSIWSIKDLVGGWFPPPPEAKQLGLGKALGLAERMFGFVSDHDKNGSHPFRGKLRFEPLWVPTETNPIEIQLAPLTSPKSRAKSRPLYLAGRQNGTSASYSDPEYAKPEFRGRKFYWKQRYKNGDLWEFHKYNENAHASGQRQPKFAALPASTKFETRIHFENLSQPEVGVLLYALLGLDSAIQPNGSWKSGNHCIHLGKGKPRGLGVCEVEAKITWFKPKEEYASLRSRPSRPVATEEEIGQARYAFASWCEARAHAVGQVGPFESLLHISEFIKLHSYPTEDSVRYYPVNWSQYTWLPEPNRNPDEPQGRSRPLAMDTARKLEP
jgi:CRISPR-associated protein (TIGR03986 family)